MLIYKPYGIQLWTQGLPQMSPVLMIVLVISLLQFFYILEFRNGWFIRTASKSFAVYAATSTEKEEWMAHIEKCIEDLLRKSIYRILFVECTISPSPAIFGLHHSAVNQKYLLSLNFTMFTISIN